jgi:GT2 family glycosyltransferase
VALDAIVVSFNSRSQLARLLSSGAVRRSFDGILVVDNASRDDSAALARSLDATVVRRDENGGLAVALNQGLRASRSQFVALLNPDVDFDDFGLPQKLLSNFDAPDVGLVAPRLVLPSGVVQDSARCFPGPAQLAARRITGSTHGAIEIAQAIDVPWVVLAFVIVRRAAWDDVGGFDEKFFLYFEDVDFCLRLWQSGWRVRLDPSVSACHDFGAASRTSWFGWAARQHARSAVRFFAKHPQLLTPSGREKLLPVPSGPSRRQPVGLNG